MLEFKTDLKRYLPFRFPYNATSSPLVSLTEENGERVQYSVEPKVGVRRKVEGTYVSEVVLNKGAITHIKVGFKDGDIYVYSDTPDRGLSNITVVRGKRVIKTYTIPDAGKDAVWFVPYEGVMYLFYEKNEGLYYFSEEDGFKTSIKVFDLINKKIHFLGLTEDGALGFMPKVNDTSLLGVETSFRQVYLPEAHFNFKLRGDTP